MLTKTLETRPLLLHISRQNGRPLPFWHFLATPTSLVRRHPLSSNLQSTESEEIQLHNPCEAKTYDVPTNSAVERHQMSSPVKLLILHSLLSEL